MPSPRRNAIAARAFFMTGLQEGGVASLVPWGYAAWVFGTPDRLAHAGGARGMGFSLARTSKPVPKTLPAWVSPERKPQTHAKAARGMGFLPVANARAHTTGSLGNFVASVVQTCIMAIHAGVAELADAYGSGPYEGFLMKVQVLSPAPLHLQSPSGLFFCLDLTKN